MELYIIRHAIAVPRGTPGYQDGKRPLTEAGRKRMGQAAKAIKLIMPDIDILLTSPDKRAYDTAMIVAKKMKWKDRLKIFEPLKSGTDTAELIKKLGDFNKYKRIVLVGHEPDLSTLISVLLGAEQNTVELRKGGIARIDVDGLPPKSRGVLRWLLKPAQLRALAK
jgi:phosphohistidine phosphatase